MPPMQVFALLFPMTYCIPSKNSLYRVKSFRFGGMYKQHTAAWLSKEGLLFTELTAFDQKTHKHIKSVCFKYT